MSIKIDVRPGPMTADFAVHRFRFFRRRLVRLYGLVPGDPDLDGMVLAGLQKLPQPMRAAIYREAYRRRQRHEQERLSRAIARFASR